MLKKLFFAKDQLGLSHISWTKVGVAICSVTSALLAAGLCPPAAVPIAKGILAVGAGLGLIGARDALGKQ